MQEQVCSENSYTVPAGTISMFASNIAPFGYLLCDGSEISRTSYRVLFNVINTKFGAGDGKKTFNLPDFRNRFPIGAGDDFTMAQTGGDHWRTLVSNNLPDHLHSGNLGQAGGPLVIEGVGVTDYGTPSDEHGTYGFTTGVGETKNTNGTVVGNTAFSILNKYIGIYYIIKY